MLLRPTSLLLGLSIFVGVASSRDAWAGVILVSDVDGVFVADGDAGVPDDRRIYNDLGSASQSPWPTSPIGPTTSHIAGLAGLFFSSLADSPVDAIYLFTSALSRDRLGTRDVIGRLRGEVGVKHMPRLDDNVMTFDSMVFGSNRTKGDQNLNPADDVFAGGAKKYLRGAYGENNVDPDALILLDPCPGFVARGEESNFLWVRDFTVDGGQLDRDIVPAEHRAEIAELLHLVAPAGSTVVNHRLIHARGMLAKVLEATSRGTPLRDALRDLQWTRAGADRRLIYRSHNDTNPEIWRLGLRALKSSAHYDRLTHNITRRRPE